MRSVGIKLDLIQLVHSNHLAIEDLISELEIALNKNYNGWKEEFKELIRHNDCLVKFEELNEDVLYYTAKKPTKYLVVLKKLTVDKTNKIILHCVVKFTKDDHLTLVKEFPQSKIIYAGIIANDLVFVGHSSSWDAKEKNAKWTLAALGKYLNVFYLAKKRIRITNNFINEVGLHLKSA